MLRKTFQTLYLTTALMAAFMWSGEALAWHRHHDHNDDHHGGHWDCYRGHCDWHQTRPRRHCWNEWHHNHWDRVCD